MWESRSVFCAGFSKQLVGNHQKDIAEGILFDFHSCGIFHSPSRPPIFSVRGRGDRYS
jgi:hypothetical protein